MLSLCVIGSIGVGGTDEPPPQPVNAASARYLFIIYIYPFIFIYNFTPHIKINL